MLPWLAAFIGAAIAMTVGMVRFSEALIDPEPSSRKRMGWGLVYALAWIAILYDIERIPADDVDPRQLGSVAVLAIAGWAALNAWWVTIWFAIGRARMRAGALAPMPRDAAVLTARAKWIAVVATAVAIAAAWTAGMPQSILASMFAPGRRAASIAMLLAAAGFTSFMAGGVRLALYSSGSKTFDVTELGDAWRNRLWRREPVWLSVFLMCGGVLAAVIGGLATIVIRLAT